MCFAPYSTWIAIFSFFSGLPVTFPTFHHHTFRSPLRSRNDNLQSFWKFRRLQLHAPAITPIVSISIPASKHSRILTHSNHIVRYTHVVQLLREPPCTRIHVQ